MNNATAITLMNNATAITLMDTGSDMTSFPLVSLPESWQLRHPDCFALRAPQPFIHPDTGCAKEHPSQRHQSPYIDVRECVFWTTQDDC